MTEYSKWDLKLEDTDVFKNYGELTFLFKFTVAYKPDPDPDVDTVVLYALANIDLKIIDITMIKRKKSGNKDRFKIDIDSITGQEVQEKVLEVIIDKMKARY